MRSLHSLRSVEMTAGLLLLSICSPAFAVALPSAETGATGYTQLDVILLIAYVSLALVFSFLCSVAEAVLLSITPSYIAGLQEKRPRRAALVKQLKIDNVDRSLAAILTLNTIAHTVGAIGSGAKATVVFGSAWFGLFSAVMTLMILFLSEIIPKTLGAVYWRHLVGLTAQFVRLLIFALYPLILVTEQLTKLVARGKKPHVFSRDEFVAMADVGKRAGQIDDNESRIIRNLFRFKSLVAGDVMTPRTVMVALSQNLTVDEALTSPSVEPFSRLPVFEKDADDITGFVMKDDLLLTAARQQGEQTLAVLRRPIISVAANTPLSQLLEQMLDRRQHIAIISGDYGGTRGLVTMEDILETLLGAEIIDEMDKVEDMQAWARERWQKRARAQGILIEDEVADD